MVDFKSPEDRANTNDSIAKSTESLKNSTDILAEQINHEENRQASILAEKVVVDQAKVSEAQAASEQKMYNKFDRLLEHGADSEKGTKQILAQAEKSLRFNTAIKNGVTPDDKDRISDGGGSVRFSDEKMLESVPKLLSAVTDIAKGTYGVVQELANKLVEKLQEVVDGKSTYGFIQPDVNPLGEVMPEEQKINTVRDTGGLGDVNPELEGLSKYGGGFVPKPGVKGIELPQLNIPDGVNPFDICEKDVAAPSSEKVNIFVQQIDAVEEAKQQKATEALGPWTSSNMRGLSERAAKGGDTPAR